MHASVPLVFTFAGSRVPPLNPAWVETMMTLAASAQGLVLLTEQQALDVARGKAAPRA